MKNSKTYDTPYKWVNLNQNCDRLEDIISSGKSKSIPTLYVRKSVLGGKAWEGFFFFFFNGKCG